MVANGYGAKQAGFVEQFQTRAEFNYAKGSERVLADRLEAIQPILVRVRSNIDTLRIRPDWQMRDIHTGVAYAIRAIAPSPDRSAISILVEGGSAA